MTRTSRQEVIAVTTASVQVSTAIHRNCFILAGFHESIPTPAHRQLYTPVVFYPNISVTYFSKEIAI